MRLAIVLVGLLLAGCGIVPNGYGGYCTPGPDCDRQHEQMRSLGIAPGYYPTPPASSPFDYATGKKPGCTNMTGYGTGC